MDYVREFGVVSVLMTAEPTAGDVAIPPVLSAVVYRRGERAIARGESLKRVGRRFPMARLTKADTRVTREDRWPHQDDLGAPVLPPGGEVGILSAWWNAEDGSEWRWQVAFYNHP